MSVRVRGDFAKDSSLSSGLARPSHALGQGRGRGQEGDREGPRQAPN